MKKIILFITALFVVSGCSSFDSSFDSFFKEINKGSDRCLKSKIENIDCIVCGTTSTNLPIAISCDWSISE